MKSNGFAPTRVEGYTLDGGIHFASVWTEVGRGCRWDLEFNLSSGDYQVLADANYDDTRLIHVDSYHDGSIARYAGIWWDQSGPTLAASHGGHWYTFQRLLNNRSCEGYALDNFYADEAPSGWNYLGRRLELPRPAQCDGRVISANASRSSHQLCRWPGGRRDRQCHYG